MIFSLILAGLAIVYLLSKNRADLPKKEQHCF